LEKWDNFIASHTAALAQDWIKKKCPGFIGKKTNGQRIHQISLSPLYYHVWGAMLGRYQKYTPNRPTLPCYRYGMICHKSSLIRQSCHFERELDRVLLQLVDILNTQFKYQEGS